MEFSTCGLMPVLKNFRFWRILDFGIGVFNLYYLLEIISGTLSNLSKATQLIDAGVQT